MKYFICISLLLIVTGFSVTAGDTAAIYAMIERVLPGRSRSFSIAYAGQKESKDVYRIGTANGKVLLSGNNNVSIAKAFAHYLSSQCNASVSWSGDQLSVPTQLPLVKKTIYERSPYAYRFYFNYCTFSYSMAFWDWPRWEKEIDWMAMHGINLALAITGQEAVWQNTLQRLGYTDAAIKEFICGPAFTAWWLMGNLEGWGGPVPQSWIDQQKLLQQKIVERMKELDIKPVLQGFYGMVPNSFRAKNPGAAIHDPGTWLGFKRPAMLMPTDKLFKSVAAIYYEEQRKLYGVADYYQGDPFHEGGNAEGVDLPAAGEAIYRSMTRFQPNAKWVLQAWQNNPRAALLQNITKGNIIITDIMAEAKPQWGGRAKYEKQRTNGYEGHDWIWSEIPNFGGRTGMTAKLDSTNIDLVHALHHSIGKQSLKGIGATPEGIGQDAILYDLLYDLGWTNSELDLDQWMGNYIRSRYGKADKNMYASWQMMRRSVYRSGYGKKDPPYESIFCARPGWNKMSGSTWGTGEPDYDPAVLSEAWTLAMKSMHLLRSVATYQYDMVNLTRQVIANLGRTLYYQVQKAYEAKDLPLFSALSSQFLELISDQDRLLSTRSEFMLGNWLNPAKQKGNIAEEKQLYEWNARTLITTWTHELNEVNDYSGREWSGLLKDYYYQRWAMFFDNATRELSGNTKDSIDFFSFEKNWTYEQKKYPGVPVAAAEDIVNEMFRKYGGAYSFGTMIRHNAGHIKYAGRIQFADDKATLYWSGSSAEISFTGKKIYAVLKDSTGLNYYTVELDGKVVGKIKIDTVKRYYLIADNVPAGKHTIRLFKSTQWDKGSTCFYGFSVSGDTKIHPAPLAGSRSIEFYGDSITSGSAVEDSSGADSGESRYENNYRSYAALVARHYNASYASIARSGIGLMVSWFPLIMPELYDRLNPFDSSSKWNFEQFDPQLVVVNLLQNDSWLVSRPSHPQYKARFGDSLPARTLIVTAYRKFINDLRLKYPQAKIVCVLGNMDITANGSPWPGYVSEAIAGMDPRKTMTCFFPYKQTPGHPRVHEQSAMADQLIHFIDKNKLWQQ